jgi:cytochrome c oxidase cbb3-type subunit III
MRQWKSLLITALLAPSGIVHGETDVPSGTANLSNPYAGDGNAVAAGEKLFAAMNCDGCHGGGALGWAAPSLADGRWRFGGEDSAVFHSIYYGRPHGMPAYGGILPADAVWMLVTYVKTRPVPREVPTAAWQATG